VIVVGALAAHVDHRVDRGAPAQYATACVADRAPVEARLGLGLEAPIGARIADRVQVPDRDVDPEVVVLPAGFEQQHARIGSRRQAVRQDATGSPGTDDYVVVPVSRLHARFSN
jgi:hypothetical protein